MWNLTKRVFKDTHTGVDGTSYDWAKVTGSGSIMTYLGMCAYHLKDDNIFEPIPFATGLCAIIAAVCGGVAIKSISKSEPMEAK